MGLIFKPKKTTEKISKLVIVPTVSCLQQVLSFFVIHFGHEELNTAKVFALPSESKSFISFRGFEINVGDALIEQEIIEKNKTKMRVSLIGPEEIKKLNENCSFEKLEKKDLFRKTIHH